MPKYHAMESGLGGLDIMETSVRRKQTFFVASTYSFIFLMVFGIVSFIVYLFSKDYHVLLVFLGLPIFLLFIHRYYYPVLTRAISDSYIDPKYEKEIELMVARDIKGKKGGTKRRISRKTISEIKKLSERSLKEHTSLDLLVENLLDQAKNSKSPQ